MNKGEEEAPAGADDPRKDELSNTTSSSADKVDTKEDNGQDLERRKKILYGAGADALCEFEGGDPIKVNKSFLAYFSTVFTDIFFGESPITTVKIEDFDRESFQTFLDCLFDLKECTVSDALLIYPIAYKYNVLKLRKICYEVFLPEEMNENVCLTLNLATFYGDKPIGSQVISFLYLKVGFFNLLDNESYRNLLEPSAISRIIQETEMNSILWAMIYKWGESYLKKHNKPHSTIRLLFEENDILSKISLDDFESADSILDFHDFSKKELFDPDRILDFLRYNVIQNKCLPSESVWERVNEGDKIVEIIQFENSFRASRDKARNGIILTVSSNILYYKKYKSVNCSLRYFYKKGSSESGDSYSYGPYLPALDHAKNLFERTKKKFYSSFPIDKDLTEFVITKVEITYRFLCDCAILKTSVNKSFRSDQVCFTRKIEFEVK